MLSNSGRPVFFGNKKTFWKNMRLELPKVGQRTIDLAQNLGLVTKPHGMLSEWVLPTHKTAIGCQMCNRLPGSRQEISSERTERTNQSCLSEFSQGKQEGAKTGPVGG